MRRRLFILFFLLETIVSCGGPVPYADADVPAVSTLDTTIFASGDWMTGGYDVSFPEDDHSKSHVPFLVVSALVLATGVCIGFRHQHRKHLEREKEESQAVLQLLQEKVSMVRRLAEKHKVTRKQAEATSYTDKLESLEDTVARYHATLEELRGDLDFQGDLETALNIGKNGVMAKAAWVDINGNRYRFKADGTMATGKVNIAGKYYYFGTNGVMQKARQYLGANVSEEDYRILACLFAGMTPASISFVTSVKPGTIRTKKSRFKARFMEHPSSSVRKLLLGTLEKPL